MPRPMLIIHSSDDMYGADRMLLEVIGSLAPVDRQRVIVWLPTDYEHGAQPLCEALAADHIAFEHVDLPIVRRKYVNPAGLVALSRRLWSVRARLRSVDPAQVLLATSAALPVAPVLGRKGSTRVVLHLQEIWRGREGKVLGALARRVDRVIAISQASKDSLPDRLKRLTAIVPNGTVEPDSVVPVTSHSGPLVFIVASRWNAWKGHEFLLRAWDEAGCPGKLIVLGGPPAMGESVDVRSLVAALSQPDTVDVRGEVPDVGAAINEADVMIVPSTQPEPFGLVTIEAFARGRAVVASATGGLLETVRDGSGWLVPPGDVAALASRLRSLDRAEVEAAGEQARIRYEDRYSLPAFRAAMRAALEGGTHPGEQTALADPA